MTGLSIVDERPCDEPAIAALNRAAFGGDDEARIVDALRANGGVVLSLVALVADEVVGHIVFSPVSIDGAPDRAIGLAPMAVLPEHQRRGVGTALVREGLARLTAAGHGAVVVLGHPDYYPRFGFERASRFLLRCAFECPDEAFMAMELRAGALGQQPGVVRYRPEFG
jgi:putative acetyltransferase